MWFPRPNHGKRILVGKMEKSEDSGIQLTGKKKTIWRSTEWWLKEQERKQWQLLTDANHETPHGAVTIPPPAGSSLSTITLGDQSCAYSARTSGRTPRRRLPTLSNSRCWGSFPLRQFPNYDMIPHQGNREDVSMSAFLAIFSLLVQRGSVPQRLVLSRWVNNIVPEMFFPGWRLLHHTAKRHSRPTTSTLKPPLRAP